MKDLINAWRTVGRIRKHAEGMFSHPTAAAMPRGHRCSTRDLSLGELRCAAGSLQAVLLKASGSKTLYLSRFMRVIPLGCPFGCPREAPILVWRLFPLAFYKYQRKSIETSYHLETTLQNPHLRSTSRASNKISSAMSESKTSAITNQPAISSVYDSGSFVCTTSRQKADPP